MWATDVTQVQLYNAHMTQNSLKTEKPEFTYVRVGCTADTSGYGILLIKVLIFDYVKYKFSLEVFHLFHFSIEQSERYYFAFRIIFVTHN